MSDFDEVVGLSEGEVQFTLRSDIALLIQRLKKMKDVDPKEIAKELEEMLKRYKGKNEYPGAKAAEEEDKKKKYPEANEAEAAREKKKYPEYPKYPYPPTEEEKKKRKGTVKASAYGVAVAMHDLHGFSKAKDNVYKAELLRTGVISHPQLPMMSLQITRRMLEQAVQGSKTTGHKIPVTLNHPEGKIDPRTVVGWVTGLEVKGNSLWATMEIKSEEVAKAIDEGRIKYVSVGLRFASPTMKPGQMVPVEVDHVALTPKPFITDLEPIKKAAEQAPIFQDCEVLPVACALEPCEEGVDMSERKDQTRAPEQKQEVNNEVVAQYEQLRANHEQLKADFAELQKKLREIEEERAKLRRESALRDLSALLEKRPFAPATREALKQFGEKLLDGEASFEDFVKLVGGIQIGDAKALFEEMVKAQTESSEWVPVTDEIFAKLSERWSELRNEGKIRLTADGALVRRDVLG